MFPTITARAAAAIDVQPGPDLAAGSTRTEHRDTLDTVNLGERLIRCGIDKRIVQERAVTLLEICKRLYVERPLFHCTARVPGNIGLALECRIDRLFMRRRVMRLVVTRLGGRGKRLP